MVPANDDGSAARNAFLRLFLADLQADGPRTLSDYQALFPAHAATIVREHALLMDPTAEAPAGSTASERARGLREDPLFAATAGQRFGSYVLVRPLGRGGQGVVWLARDLRLERLVALKLLTHLAALSPEALARFRREAQVASRLSDPGICTVFESGTESAVPFIAMRYVEGETLAEKLARARDAKRQGGVAGLDLPARADDQPEDGLARLALLTERIARSLHLAHQAGVVHRDLKPGNIMVEREGLPVLLDFELAGVLDESSPTLTRTGDVFGTPAYMAPEQITQTAGVVDRRADVYALGATLYECLTLQPPFESVTRAALFQAICHESPSDPRRIDPRIPADLKTILETCLAKDRDRRYQSALDLAEDLGRWRIGEPILAHPPSQTYRLRMLVRRHRTAAASVLALVLVLAVATALTTAGMLSARTKAAEVLRLSTLQDLDDLARHADELWPVDPERIPAFESWLAEARGLLADLPEHERTIAELRARAVPRTEAEHTAQRAGHPLRPRLDSALGFRVQLELDRGLAGFSWAAPLAPMARVELQVTGLGGAFDGSGLQLGASSAMDGGLHLLDELVPFPSAVGPAVRWRMRLRTNNPLLPVTPWVSIPSNGITEAKLRAVLTLRRRRL